jgi:exocyst complex component 4
MAGRVYVTDQDAEVPEDFIVALTTQIARRDEEMAAYVPPLKRSYIFGGICSVSATAFIKALNDMKAINMLGVRQICRNCIALQQVLLSLNIHLFHSTSVSYSLLHFPCSFQH